MNITLQCNLCDARLTLDEFRNQQTLCHSCMDQAIGMTNLSIDELNALPYGVIIINQDGVISSYNDWEQQLSGKTPAEVIGKNFFTEVAPCTNVQEFGGRFTEFLKSNNGVESFEFLFRFPSRPVRVNIAFVKFGDDKLIRILVRKSG